MKEIIKNNGIVIKTIDYQENAVIATILTEKDIRSYVIKGAKKISASTFKLANLLTEISFTHTSASFPTLIEGVVVNNYTNLKCDMLKINIAMCFLKKIYDFREAFKPNKAFYAFFKDTLDILEKTAYPKAAMLMFDVKFLYMLGVAPSFKECANCGCVIPGGFFKVNCGGAICNECKKSLNYDLDQTDTALLKVLYYQKMNKINDDLLKEINNHPLLYHVIDEYYSYHLEYDFKMRGLIDTLARQSS